jgi:hypothetical protein
MILYLYKYLSILDVDNVSLMTKLYVPPKLQQLLQQQLKSEIG